MTAKTEKIKKSKAIEVKDLNTSTAADLTQVRGIGEVLSKRIVKYRTRLQGFDELDQLIRSIWFRFFSRRESKASV